MTDPRIIECAKAMFADEGVADAWDASQVLRDEWCKYARACILKWLEQEPTHAMWLAAESYCPMAHDTWREMCAQAAKEIAE